MTTKAKKQETPATDNKAGPSTLVRAQIDAWEAAHPGLQLALFANDTAVAQTKKKDLRIGPDVLARIDAWEADHPGIYIVVSTQQGTKFRTWTWNGRPTDPDEDEGRGASWNEALMQTFALFAKRHPPLPKEGKKSTDKSKALKSHQEAVAAATTVLEYLLATPPKA